jgi:SAM-dependent methyltransferase
MESEAGKPGTPGDFEKRRSELHFWRTELTRYRDWFFGSVSALYKTPSPSRELRDTFGKDAQAPVRAWHALHQAPKYLADLALAPGSLRGQVVLDLGSGPFPSAAGLGASQLLCLDALLLEYRESGYPSGWGGGIGFIAGMAESIPLARHSLDAMISVNALDHVDDIQQTVREIRRVLRPGGLLRFHLHYHAPTACEPIAFTDEMVATLFSWAGGFHPCVATRQNFSTDLPEAESFRLWSNF